MKRFALALTTVTALALVTSSAFATDRVSGPSHAELAHRSNDRAVTHDTVHRVGISHYQDHRLHRALRHEATHDRIEHRATRPQAHTYRYSTPSHRRVITNRHATVPTWQYAAPAYQIHRPAYRPAYRTHGLSISTRNFSLSFGH